MYRICPVRQCLIMEHPKKEIIKYVSWQAEPLPVVLVLGSILRPRPPSPCPFHYGCSTRVARRALPGPHAAVRVVHDGAKYLH